MVEDIYITVPGPVKMVGPDVDMAQPRVDLEITTMVRLDHTDVVVIDKDIHILGSVLSTNKPPWPSGGWFS